ncbi:unnamed protein product [Pylaiella littoralis]
MREAFLEALRGISRDQVVNVCGAVGGLVLLGAQLPQAYRVTTRGSASDVSYVFQLIFACGMAMCLVYYGYYNLWPAFVPACLSLACGLYLLAYKAYLDALRPKRTEATSSVTDRIMREDGGAGGVDRRPLLEEAAEREEDEFIAYPAPTS